MAKHQVTLSFTPETIAEPIIYTISQQFNLVTNIRQANLADGKGWILLELEGKEADIKAGIAWATSMGVRAEPISEED